MHRKQEGNHMRGAPGMTEAERRNKKAAEKTREKFGRMNGRQERLTETKSGGQIQSSGGGDKIEVSCRLADKDD